MQSAGLGHGARRELGAEDKPQATSGGFLGLEDRFLCGISICLVWTLA